MHLLDPGTLRQRGVIALQPRDEARLALSPTGDRLVAAVNSVILTNPEPRSQARLRSWRTSDRSELLARDPGQSVVGLGMSRDGRLIAVAGGQGRVEVRDATTFDVVGAPIQHTAAVRAVAFSPDGGTLATISTMDAVVRLWDARTGASVARLTGLSGDPNTVAFHPTRPLLATGGADAAVVVWDLDPERVRRQLCATLATSAGSAGEPTPAGCG
ncbi:MAG TPA: hypothetical protein VES42_15530 [Pilimelia sp.]|nr:hypothetical protein [Pilimelia sp.]